jgi:hypothetical protein
VSFRRRPESRHHLNWFPAFAGKTSEVAKGLYVNTNIRPLINIYKGNGKGGDMNYRRLFASLITMVLIFAQSALAADLSIKNSDTIQSLLEAKKGTIITLRLTDGEEMTGKVRFVSKELVQLEELSGKDYYDGIVDIKNISAIVIRVKK